MLRRALSMLAGGGIGNTAELAAALGVPPALVAVMVKDLERRGLLQRAAEAGTSCAACPARPGCPPQAACSAWLLTEAGHRIAGS